ncbi:hypothetical protein GUJ93_ZPchr0003g18516 [Zizania palustris]|uniref:VQ domain-containing protein n=1 Tax=Zizania palustris TaxID=103762 RepID=A0A8J5VCW7_ZIZPA|nr:hypothetical protein GUJ93_ZPchr0003g18516 [Zizania palustris]
MTMATPSSRRGAAGLRGPRPQPRKVSSSSRCSSPSSSSAARNSKKAPHGGGAPVIVYEHTPRVVHARPQEFMTVVQRLTGKLATSPASASPPQMLPATSVYAPGFSPEVVVEEGAAVSSDPLLLTIEQRQQAAPLPPPTVPSPMAAGTLLSPGFIFSPNTMQSIRELSPLF